EELERLIGKALPELPRRKELDKLGPADLAAALPNYAVFIDLIRYTRFEKGKPPSLHYVAFALSHKGEIRRVELGPAEPIDLAVDLWRQTVAGWSSTLKSLLLDQLQVKADKQAAALRRLVWTPLSKHLPKGVSTMYVAGDGNLAR